VVGVVEVDHLVVASTQRQVVEDDVVRPGLLQPESADLDAVAAAAGVAPGAAPQVADDEVVDAVVVGRDDALDRDAGPRGRSGRRS
jgi:hypothetical protein